MRKTAYFAVVATVLCVQAVGGALALINEGKAINYQGVIGNVSFDQYGDISGPSRLWQIKGGAVVTNGPRTAADVAAQKASMT